MYSFCSPLTHPLPISLLLSHVTDHCFEMGLSRLNSRVRLEPLLAALSHCGFRKKKKRETQQLLLANSLNTSLARHYYWSIYVRISFGLVFLSDMISCRRHDDSPESRVSPRATPRVVATRPSVHTLGMKCLRPLFNLHDH